jgi:hypothetical protein
MKGAGSLELNIQYSELFKRLVEKVLCEHIGDALGSAGNQHLPSTSTWTLLARTASIENVTCSTEGHMQDVIHMTFKDTTFKTRIQRYIT